MFGIVLLGRQANHVIRSRARYGGHGGYGGWGYSLCAIFLLLLLKNY